MHLCPVVGLDPLAWTGGACDAVLVLLVRFLLAVYVLVLILDLIFLLALVLFQSLGAGSLSHTRPVTPWILDLSELCVLLLILSDRRGQRAHAARQIPRESNPASETCAPPPVEE